MKRLKSFVTIVMVMALTTALFSGCGTTAPEQKENGSDTQASGESNQTKESGRTMEIEFFQQKVEAVDTFNTLIEKFESENPDIKVVQNNVPDPGSVLMARVASGDAPDVLLDYPNAAEFVIRAQEGFLYDLSGQSFLDNVKPGVIESIAIDGGNYSLPISVNTIGVYYNTAIFDELGLKAPKNYAEFEKVLQAIKDSGRTPIALADKESWTVGISMNQMSGTEFDDAAGFYASLEDGSGDATQSAELRQIAERIVALRDYGTEDALAVGYGDAVNLFANGEVAMLIQGIWAKPSIEEANPEIEFSMFPVPATNEADQKVIYGIDAAVSIGAETEYPEAALKFLEFLAQPENAQIFADLDGSPSTIVGVESKVEEFTLLTTLLDEGRSFEWHHFKWAAGMEGQFNDTAQSLVVDKDVDAYLEQMNAVFLNSNQ